MKKIFLDAYLKHNLGDDLFLEIISNRYKSHEFLINNSIDMNYKNMFDNIKPNKSKFKYFFFRFLNKIFKNKNILYEKKIKNCDCKVTIGGSIFMENKNYYKNQINELSKNSAENIEKYILGANFGPYYHDEYLLKVKESLKNYEDVCFRDKYSYKLFKDLKNVRVKPDIIYSLDTKKYQKKDEKLVTFSLIDCNSRTNLKKYAKSYENKIIELINYFYEKDYKICLMSFCKYENDEKAIKSILQNILQSNMNMIRNITTYEYINNIDEALELIGKSEYIVGTRFHANILGLKFQKKLIPIAYSDKTINALTDIGYKGKIYHLDKIDELDISKIKYHILDKDELEKLSIEAEQQFEKLDKILK